MRLPHIPALVCSIALAPAQNCFDGDFGTLLAVSPVDVVLPVQAIGFPFVVGSVSYTDLHISDHGFVQFSNGGTPTPATGAVLYNPTLANFAAGSAKAAPLYADIVGTGGGRIYLSRSPARCVVTWWSMQNYAGGSVSTNRFSFQLVLYPGGAMRCLYGPGVTNASTSPPPSDQGICGLTPGGGIALPAAVDFSIRGSIGNASVLERWLTPNTFDLANNNLLVQPGGGGYAWTTGGAQANCASAPEFGSGCFGVGLTTVGLPTIGNSNFVLQMTGVPAVSPVAFFGFGTAAIQPGFPLASAGMAGCWLHSNLDSGLFGVGPVQSGICNGNLPIPNSPQLFGFSLAVQGVVLSTFTLSNLATSNAVQMTIGL